jgi:oligoendopeptidase F
MKKTAKIKTKDPVWNLGLLYKSQKDPQIEKDLKALENLYKSFSERFDTTDKKYLTDENVLEEALIEYEKIRANIPAKPLLYFYLSKDIDTSNSYVSAQMSLISDRLAKADNHIVFFFVTLGQIPQDKKEQFLSSPKLKKYKVFLKRIFDDAKHRLSTAEEKIINLKNLPAYDMWVDGNERALGKLSVDWKGEKLPMAKAQKMIRALPTKERHKLDELICQQFKSVSPFSEAEINAVFTDKKINDELRNYKLPYEATVRGYRNDPEVVKKLVETITKSFSISHRFFKIKAKILKLKKLKYTDRTANIGVIDRKFSFSESINILKKTFGEIDKKYSDILESFVKKGQLDVAAKMGKAGGAYCFGSYLNPTFVLLNHNNDFDSFSTIAHEMGHAFHTELSRSQSSFYFRYSTSLAETASTLFESIATESVFEDLSDKEKIIVLHNKILDDINTIFRQIAGFNFELELHNAVRSKGFVSAEEICEIHNKNMKSYLGPVFDMKLEDGYFFTMWSHIRRFFYVYTYAYGQLVTKALLRRYRKDKSFWKSIEKFLSAGGNGSPEEILLSIGIDVSKPEFWQEGLKEIEEDIEKLEGLVKGK